MHLHRWRCSLRSLGYGAAAGGCDSTLTLMLCARPQAVHLKERLSYPGSAGSMVDSVIGAPQYGHCGATDKCRSSGVTRPLVARTSRRVLLCHRAKESHIIDVGKLKMPLAVVNHGARWNNHSDQGHRQVNKRDGVKQSASCCNSGTAWKKSKLGVITRSTRNSGRLATSMRNSDPLRLRA
jgi:hypothetical protein